MLKKFLKKILIWVFEEEYKNFQENLDYIKEVVGDKVSSCVVDYHYNSESWAVIHLQGENKSYMKFLKLKKGDCIEIIKFLKRFNYVDIDANPHTSKFIKCELGL